MTTAKPLPAPPKEPGMRELTRMAPELSAKDRCDVRGCGARAYVRATLPTGQLYFCGHHGYENMLALSVAGAVILDETSQIGDKRVGL